MKRTELRRKTPMLRTSATRPSRPRYTGPTAKVRALVRARDGGCIICGDQTVDLQHRRARGMGGSTNPDYLRAAAGELRECAYLDGSGHYSRGSSTFEVAVANWLDAEAEQAQVDERVWRAATESGWGLHFRHPLAIAAVVLGRSWPS